MNSDGEINHNVMRLKFEHLLYFLRKYESQDEYNYAVRLLLLGFLYNSAKVIIDSPSDNADRNSLLSRQRHYVEEFQEVIDAISSKPNFNMNVTGETSANPSIQDFGIHRLDARELNNHFQLWKNSLESTPHDFELAETIYKLEDFLLNENGRTCRQDDRFDRGCF